MQLAGRLDMIVSQMDVVPYQDSDNALVFTADQDASGGEESEEDDEEVCFQRVSCVLTSNAFTLHYRYRCILMSKKVGIIVMMMKMMGSRWMKIMNKTDLRIQKTRWD